jgi:hypothetical protein
LSGRPTAPTTRRQKRPSIRWRNRSPSSLPRTRFGSMPSDRGPSTLRCSIRDARRRSGKRWRAGSTRGCP